MSVRASLGAIWLVGLVLVTMVCLCSCSDEECAVCPPPDSTPSGWFVQDTPTLESLVNIHAIDTQTVVAIGSGGTIVRTTDGGATWTPVSSGTTEQLRGLCFADADNGWAVGDSVVLKTTDRGTTWTEQSVPVTASFRDVRFVDVNTGWISGGPIGSETGAMVLLKTTDAGVSWDSQPTEFTYRMMHFVDADSGCAAGGADFRRTTDGGATWLAYDPMPASWFASIFFADKHNGWVAGGGGFVAHSGDGGKTWTTQNTGTTRTIVEVFFVDANQGWYVGRNPGTIATTSDGGLTWTFQTHPNDVNPSCTSFVDSEIGWISGVEGLILKTVTGGQ